MPCTGLTAAGTAAPGTAADRARAVGRGLGTSAKVTARGVRGFAQVAGLTAIEKLVVSNSDLSDDAIDYLTKLPRLTSLELRGVDIGDAGLAKIDAGRMD